MDFQFFDNIFGSKNCKLTGIYLDFFYSIYAYI
ncbi:MAG: hypothetical protein Homavirus7_9 [Homavirus sp.]|uniref:Uncharacterized protein n=1 Tax=Homavirus sp. TaxID=2487769 RepID=A0A3G5A8G3_9VIRU|nr:MAG: hypothetical protein Homavirus7_9 [Homavirus sp.]